MYFMIINGFSLFCHVCKKLPVTENETNGPFCGLKRPEEMLGSNGRIGLNLSL